MTRLESGHVKANVDWCDVADVVQVTLKEIGKDLAQHKVTVGLAAGLPLVRMDFVLMQAGADESVVERCGPYATGHGGASQCRSRSGYAGVDGSGQRPRPAAGRAALIFDKFYRAPAAPAAAPAWAWRLSKGSSKRKAAR